MRHECQEFRAIDVQQLGLCARNYRSAPPTSLLDYAHFADDAASPKRLINRATAHHPQDAALDDIKCVSWVALLEQKFARLNSPLLKYGSDQAGSLATATTTTANPL